MTNDTKKQLIEACIDGNLDEVNRLIAEGVNPNARGKKLSTALMKAAKEGHAEIAKNLLSVGANPDATDDVKWTALMFAAQNGHAEVTKVLLSAGANPNAMSSTEERKTALCIANEKWTNSETQEKALEYRQVVTMLKAAGAR